MGEVELSLSTGELIIRSVFILYGEAASEALATQLAADVSRYWNEPKVTVSLRNQQLSVRFQISGELNKEIAPDEVWFNDDPTLNFFRVEEYAFGNISFVDGIGSNTGYFKLQNLQQTPTTVAHEYGHTIGLKHPEILDVRGQGIPGIMYPRGTLCDAALQYDPLARAGDYGGVMDPAHRKVLPTDVAALRLHKLSFNSKGFAKLGGFSSFYHQKHVEDEADLR
jgi:hypothetical protein